MLTKVKMLLFCLALFLCVPTMIFAATPSKASINHNKASQTKKNATTKKLTTTKKKASSANSALKNRSLYIKSLPILLEHASLTELQQILQRWGIAYSSSDSSQTLISKIQNHFNLAQTATPKPKGTSIMISNADQAQYFKVKKIGQDFIEFSSKDYLKVYVKDTDANKEHIIYAKNVLFNRQTKTISFTGGIRYQLKNLSDGTSNQFEGQSLIFYLDSWNGILFHSKKVDGSDSNQVSFGFSGDVLYENTSKQIFYLKNGFLTSSQADPPNYGIQASKVWVTGPGEWGILNAVLKVGKVPIFWIPFYFKPGSAMFFHPYLGFAARKGFAIQTTTYLIGNMQQDPSLKDDNSGALSFLNLGNQAHIPTKLEGLFLMPDYKKKISKDQVDSTNAWVMKFMLDFYTNLGLFTGVSWSLPNLAGVFSTFSGQIGFGFSRTLYPYYGNNYIPFDFNHNFHFFSLSQFNTVEISKVWFPFRFGGNLSLGISAYNFKFNLPFYSDREYTDDFFPRHQDFELLNLMIQSSSGNGSGLEDPNNLSANMISNFLWNISFSYNFPTYGSYWPNIAIQLQQMSVQWAFKESTDADQYAKSQYDPTRYWPYPKQIVWPELTLPITGTIINTQDWQGKKVDQSKALGNDNVIKPYTDEQKKTNVSSDLPYYMQAQIPDSFPVNTDDAQDVDLSNNFSITYSLQPYILIQSTPDYDRWQDPKQMNFHLRYNFLNFKSDNNLYFKGQIFGSYVQWQDTIYLKNQYQTYFGFSHKSDENDYHHGTTSPGDIGTVAPAAESILANNQQVLSNIVNLSINPFTQFPLLTGSISYQLNEILWEYSMGHYDNVSGTPYYKQSGPKWDKDHVLAHNLNIKLGSALPIFNVNGAYQYTIAPLDPLHIFNFGSTLNYQNFQSSLTGQVNYDQLQKKWEPQDLETKGQYGFFLNQLLLSEDFTYDMNTKKVQSSISTLKIWYASFSFTAQNSTPYYPHLGGFVPGYSSKSVWPTDKTVLLPYSIQASLKYSSPDWYFWYNRVALQFTTDTTMDMNLQQYTNSTLNFDYSIILKIRNIVDLNFSFSAYNKNIYRYIPGLSEKLGIGLKTLNFFQDLWDSLNVFNRNGLEATNFKLGQVSVGITHYLKDWVLQLSYSGGFNLDSTSEKYSWQSKLNFSVQWNGISAISNSVNVDTDGNISVNQIDFDQLSQNNNSSTNNNG